jgi:hypothetical protein
MPTHSDDDLVCLPRSSVGNLHRMLIEKMCRTHSFDQLDTGTAYIFCQVFFLVSILRYPLGIG